VLLSRQKFNSTMKKQIKLIYIIAIYILSLAHVSAQELAPTKTIYKPGESVVISFSGGPGNAKDWVGIYKEGQTPGDDESTQWTYVDGGTTAALRFDPLPIGNYEAYLFLNDSYEILASESFEVSEEQDAPKVILSKAEYDEGEDVIISFSGGPGNILDWVGIYKVGDIPEVKPSTVWQHVDGTNEGVIGKSTGQLVFDPLPIGNYEAYLFLNDGYEILASESFEVSEEQDVPKVILSKAEYDEGEDVIISFSGGPGNILDWVGIYKVGDIPEVKPSTVWQRVDGTNEGVIGKSTGQLVFDPLPIGNYEAYLLLNDGYEILASASFSVTGAAMVNTAPTVLDSSVEVNEDGTASITLTGSDEEGDTLSFTVLSQPKNGTLSGTAPSLSYSPNANYSGSDSFSYKANDGVADSNTATVTITVNGINDNPEAANQDVEVNEDGTASITLTGSDGEEDTLSFTVLSQPKNGTLSGTAPTLSYSPNANYSGNDSFSYKANDGSADSNAATVTITVNGINDKPEVANQSVDVDEDGSVSITLSGSDEEGDTLSFTVLSQPKNGTLSGTAPSLSYSPNANYSGSDSFTFKANDGKADSNTATVTINVIKKEADEPVLSLSKAEYEKGEVIKVSFSGGPGNAKDWLGLYKEGELNDDNDILKRLYVDGTEEGNDAKTEGVVSVEVDLAPGSYQVSLFENDGGNILATVGFKVKKTGNNPDLEDNWTILVYGHADHNLGVNLVGDLIEMESVGSGDGLNIVVQTDFNPKAWIRGNKVSSNWLIGRHSNISDDIRNQVCRFLIDGNKNNSTFDTQPIEKLPETKNMDNADTLIDFINWGITKYPAKRYGLVLWDHGGQWTGYGGDSQNGTYDDFGFSWDNYGMKTKKIRDAIQTSFTSTGISKFDFVTFDTCLMAGVEVLVDFHDLTDVFMACAEIDYGAGWDYRALDYLKKNPNASTIEFARQEVQYWDKHHSRWGADIELRNHAAFDFNKYNEFNAAFIEFTLRLTTQQSGNIEKITRARRDAIHYWINSVGKMKQPTDYIDLGHFALKLADSLSDGDLKESCLKLAESINSMVIAKSTGNSRKESLGLSVYYPYSGNVSWKYDGLNFFTEEYGGNLWLNQLAQTKNAKISDITPPLVVVEEGNKTDTGRGKSLDSFNGEQITATYQDSALIKFSIDSSPDAYEAFASVVSNEESDNPNLYIYLGEVANIPLKGSGDYSFSWNGTLPVISQINSEAKAPPIGGSSGVDRLEQKGEFPVYLGGWYMDTNSKTMVSFADYQAYEDGEIIPLIFMTKFDSNGIGSIDTILYDNSDENESWLSPTASNVELEPGGKIWPIYYSEELKDNGEWEVYFTYFEDGYISVPEDGTEGLTISWETVYDGKYGVELQSFDNLGNGSDITEFEIVVGASGGLPSVSFSTEGGNFVLTWAMGDGGDEAVLQWVEGFGGDWSDVPSGNIDFGGDGRLYKETATAESRFFRLIKR
jgi:hypothetical protein